MVNKESLKNIILPATGLILVMILSFFIILSIQYKKYEKTVNIAVANIISNILEKYPDIKDEELIKVLRGDEGDTSNKKAYNMLKNYGYTKNLSYIKNLNRNVEIGLKIDILFCFIYGIIVTIFVLKENNKKNKNIQEVIKYLNRINNGNYELMIEENKEDELSKLRNELYKTTVLLKTTAENSEKEKINLSNSLADISHQLKTPLTSIRIMLDNLEDNPKMEESVRNEFITEISKQVDWISSLVIALLKLARFDAGSIVMKDAVVNARDFIDNVLEKLAILLDVKNVKVEKIIAPDIYISIDYNWQMEAFTNIIKNAIEHSNQNSVIKIAVEDNSIFTKFVILDEGEGISKKDLKHIFDRFYKGKNSSENSIGIGLSLSKAIIEKDNGIIKVESELGKGTRFEIEYLKK